MKIKIIVMVFFGITINTAHAQNRKEQIKALNFSIDSLTIANSNLNTILVAKDNVITENQNLIKKNLVEITELKKNI